MNTFVLPKFFLSLVVAGLAVSARADVTVPALFTHHAVLQKAEKVPVWGKAAPGESVKVTIANAAATTTADQSGAWRVDLDLSTQGPGPYELVIEGALGSKKHVATDVLIGEVWLAGGQSNMQWDLKDTTGAAEEIAAPANRQLRQFLVGRKFGPEPLDEVVGNWMVAGPNASQYFTAIGYYFGKKLASDLSTPVGLINATYGGSPIQTWMSLESLNSVAGLRERVERNRKAYEEFPVQLKAYAEAVQAWETKNHRELPEPSDPASFAGPDVSIADWKSVKLPGSLAEAGLPESGVIWLRRKVTLTADVASRRFGINLGVIPGFDSVYWNGVQVGLTSPGKGGIQGTRQYYPPATMTLQPGEGLLAIRLVFPVGGAKLPGPLNWGSIPLAGDWYAKVEKELPPPDATAKTTFPASPGFAPLPINTASYLYNGMIAPLMPYAFRGVIWYQGENNTWLAEQYRTLFPLMIKDWRSRWNQGDFPFYFCQLANWRPHKSVPGDSDIAELREAQAMALSLPKTGMAVLVDCGEAEDVHFRNKKPAADRLAAIALANVYGKTVPFAGPTYASMEIEGDSLRIRFTHADGGLVAKPLPAEFAPKSSEPDKKVPLVRNVPNSPLEGFALCGEDRVWKWAEAKIDGQTIVVRAEGVAEPVAVRYAWADNPICNLYNGAGFPAVPFRSDDFPVKTANRKFQ
jgi:sialate O-acetylesterase